MSALNVLGYILSFNFMSTLKPHLSCAFILLLYSTFNPAHSSPISFSAKYFEDTDSKYSLDELLTSPGDTLFESPGDKGLSFGWVDNPYWYKVEIKANDKNSDIIMLDIAWPLLDKLDIYVTNSEKQLISVYKLGDHKPFSKRPVFDSHFVIPLNIKKEPLQTLYFNVVTTSSMQLPIKFYSQDEYRKHRAVLYSIQGIFYGLLIVMSFYNLFIYLATRHIAYLHYFGFVVSFGILQAGLKGSGFQFVWPNATSLNDYSIATGGAFCLLFLTLFARSFLQLNQVDVLKKTNNVMLFIATLFVFTSFIISYKAIITPLAITVIVFSITVIVTAILRYRQGFTEARYYLLAWIALVIGCIIYLSKQLGLLPINTITENALQIGSALEILLLSFALADRLNSLGRSLEQVNHKLEKQVKKRTSELMLALENLSEANERLSVISVTDRLTGLHNRHHFDITLEKELGKAQKKQENMSLLLIDIDHFKNINDTWGHLTGDKALQFVSRKLETACKNITSFICRYGGEEFVVTLPGASLEKACELAGEICVQLDKSEYIEDKTKIPLTVSIGVSSSKNVSSMNAEEFIKTADIALYNAKGDGRNCVHIFDKDAHAKDNSVQQTVRLTL